MKKIAIALFLIIITSRIFSQMFVQPDYTSVNSMTGINIGRIFPDKHFFYLPGFGYDIDIYYQLYLKRIFSLRAGIEYEQIIDDHVAFFCTNCVFPEKVENHYSKIAIPVIFFVDCNSYSQPEPIVRISLTLGYEMSKFLPLKTYYYFADTTVEKYDAFLSNYEVDKGLTHAIILGLNFSIKISGNLFLDLQPQYEYLFIDPSQDVGISSGQLSAGIKYSFQKE